MKETGIVRKLDNLGRLVIPKEIRRCMRIKEGSPIEFGLLPSGEIVLCKYSLVNQISDYADDLCEVMSDVFDCAVLIGDRDKIIACHGVSKKNFYGCKLSNEVLDIIDSKISYKASLTDKTTILSIIDDDKNTYYSQLIYPITIQGENEGVVILCHMRDNVDFNNEHLIATKLISQFLSKQME